MNMSTQDPIVLRVPGMEAVNVQRNLDYGSGDSALRMDVYRPFGVGPWPVVVFVHGESDAEELRNAKEWGQYTSWGRLVAASGMVGVTFSHRSWEGLSAVPRKLGDVEAAVRFVRAHGRSWGADPSRLAVWSCSAGVPVGLSTAIRWAASCAVAYYGPMDVRPYGRDPVLAKVSPMALLEEGMPLPPLLVGRAALDDEELNQSIDAFVNLAWEQQLDVELLDHGEGHHAFDVVDGDSRSREIIEATLEFLAGHLAPNG
jgi:dienelactone hydrolase